MLFDAEENHHLRRCYLRGCVSGWLLKIKHQLTATTTANLFPQLLHLHDTVIVQNVINFMSCCSCGKQCLSLQPKQKFHQGVKPNCHKDSCSYNTLIKSRANRQLAMIFLCEPSLRMLSTFRSSIACFKVNKEKLRVNENILNLSYSQLIIALLINLGLLLCKGHLSFPAPYFRDHKAQRISCGSKNWMLAVLFTYIRPTGL